MYDRFLGVAVVADLCEALGELIADAPRVAEKTARKMADTLRRRVVSGDLLRDRELGVNEIRAAKGQDL